MNSNPPNYRPKHSPLLLWHWKEWKTWHLKRSKNECLRIKNLTTTRLKISKKILKERGRVRGTITKRKRQRTRNERNWRMKQMGKVVRNTRRAATQNYKEKFGSEGRNPYCLGRFCLVIRVNWQRFFGWATLRNCVFSWWLATAINKKLQFSGHKHFSCDEVRKRCPENWRELTLHTPCRTTAQNAHS